MKTCVSMLLTPWVTVNADQQTAWRSQKVKIYWLLHVSFLLQVFQGVLFDGDLYQPLKFITLPVQALQLLHTPLRTHVKHGILELFYDTLTQLLHQFY